MKCIHLFSGVTDETKGFVFVVGDQKLAALNSDYSIVRVTDIAVPTHPGYNGAL